MTTHDTAPSPLSTLDILGPHISPLAFSAVMFIKKDGAVLILKRSTDLPKIQKWMQSQASVQLSGHQQPGCQLLAPLAVHVVVVSFNPSPPVLTYSRQLQNVQSFDPSGSTSFYIQKKEAVDLSYKNKKKSKKNLYYG